MKGRKERNIRSKRSGIREREKREAKIRSKRKRRRKINKEGNMRKGIGEKRKRRTRNIGVEEGGGRKIRWGGR